MKKLILAVVVLGLADAAQADLQFQVIRTSNFVEGNGTFDRITFKLTGMTGADANQGSLGQPASVFGLTGTFSAVGSGAVLAVPGDNTSTSDGYWEKFISSGKGGIGTINSDSGTFNYAASFVKLDSIVPQDVSRTGTGSSTTDDLGSVATIQGNSPSFTGTWFTTGTGVVPGGILAQAFVTPGMDVSFEGKYTTYGSNGATMFVTSTPEPASVGLATVAACGLLFRRRKSPAH